MDTADKKQERLYYTRWRGQRDGPYDVQTLKEKLRQNEISLLHKVLVNGSWVSMKSFLADQRSQEFSPPTPGQASPSDTSTKESQHERAMEVERLGSQINHQDKAAVAQDHPATDDQEKVSVTANNHSTLVTAGWVMLCASFFLPLLALVPFVLGIILLAKSEVGHGIAVLILSFIAPLLGSLFWMAVIDSL